MDTSLVAERATLIKLSYLLTRLQRKKKERKLVQKCSENNSRGFHARRYFKTSKTIETETPPDCIYAFPDPLSG